MSNRKGHLGPTDRNEWTGQSGPPSKVVPNILVGLNRNQYVSFDFSLKFPEFWGLNRKLPVSHIPGIDLNMQGTINFYISITFKL